MQAKSKLDKQKWLEGINQKCHRWNSQSRRKLMLRFSHLTTSALSSPYYLFHLCFAHLFPGKVEKIFINFLVANRNPIIWNRKGTRLIFRIGRWWKCAKMRDFNAWECARIRFWPLRSSYNVCCQAVQTHRHVWSDTRTAFKQGLSHTLQTRRALVNHFTIHLEARIGYIWSLLQLKDSSCVLIWCVFVCVCVWVQSWALSVFLNFFTNKKWFFAFSIKLIWLGVGFLNRTGAEIGYQLDKKCKINHFLLVKKFKNTESAQLCQ